MGFKLHDFLHLSDLFFDLECIFYFVIGRESELMEYIIIGGDGILICIVMP